MRRALIAGLLVAALCGTASSAAQKTKKDPLASALADKVAGKPTDCINPRFSDGPQIIDDHTLLYRESGRRVWRNDLPASCPALRPMSTIIVKMYGSQLCRNDSFRVLDPGSRIPSGICRFGNFTPYDKPKGVK